MCDKWKHTEQNLKFILKNLQKKYTTRLCVAPCLKLRNNRTLKINLLIVLKEKQYRKKSYYNLHQKKIVY